MYDHSVHSLMYPFFPKLSTSYICLLILIVIFSCSVSWKILNYDEYCLFCTFSWACLESWYPHNFTVLYEIVFVLIVLLTFCAHICVLQIPLYPISMFQSEHDGEGMNLVMYFKLSESYSKDLPSHFHDSLTVRSLNYKSI